MRAKYKAQIETIPAGTIVYIDETGIDESLQRDRGRAKRGVKIYGAVSGRKYKRTNIVAAQCAGKIVAPMEYTGTTDHEIFEMWFQRMLLTQLPSGSTIVMDNASFHRKEVLHKLVQKVECKIIFLPPYSPDFNPIEKTWANLKNFLRNYACQFCKLEMAIEDFFKEE
jgi:transposase